MSTTARARVGGMSAGSRNAVARTLARAGEFAALVTPAPPRATSSEALGVRLHGAALTLRCDRPEVLAYARAHLAGLAGDATGDTDLDVRLLWFEGEGDPGSDPIPASQPLDANGGRTTGNREETLVLDTPRMPGLVLRVARNGERWHFDVAYRGASKRGHGAPATGDERPPWFSLMHWLVYYPLLWHLRRTRGMTPIHASALATVSGTVLIGGMGGTGKNTTCLALLARPGFRLLSESLTLTDGTRLYACPEPIRVDDESLPLLGGPRPALVPMDSPGGLEKERFYHASAPRECAEPGALYLPRLASRTFVEPLDSVVAAEQLHAMGRLTRELDDFEWLAAALDLRWPMAGLATRGPEALRAITSRMRCHTLGIDPARGVARVVRAILDTSGAGAAGRESEST